MSEQGERESEPWGKNGLPSREEWDFSKVPEAELMGCCVWEYARESPTLRGFRTIWSARQMSFLSKLERGIVSDADNMQEEYPEIMEIAKRLCEQKLQPLLLTYAGPVPWQNLMGSDKKANRYGFSSDPLVLSKLNVWNKALLTFDPTYFVARIDWTASNKKSKQH